MWDEMVGWDGIGGDCGAYPGKFRRLTKNRMYINIRSAVQQAEIKRLTITFLKTLFFLILVSVISLSLDIYFYFPIRPKATVSRLHASEPRLRCNPPSCIYLIRSRGYTTLHHACYDAHPFRTWVSRQPLSCLHPRNHESCTLNHVHQFPTSILLNQDSTLSESPNTTAYSK